MNFDLILAAAGSGSRMGGGLPKPLYQVNGKPLLEIILEKFKIELNKIIIVVSEHSRVSFEEFLRGISQKKQFEKLNFEIAVQTNINGTLGAVEAGLQRVKANCVFIAWGDHIGISEEMIKKMKVNIDDNQGKSLILPTVMRSNPYINFKRVENKIVEFQELKKLKFKINYGENDCGCFLFDTVSILKSIENFKLRNGDRESEVNFLEVIPFLEKEKEGILTQVESDLQLTMGINSIEDVKNYLNQNFKMAIYDDK